MHLPTVPVTENLDNTKMEPGQIIQPISDSETPPSSAPPSPASVEIVPESAQANGDDDMVLSDYAKSKPKQPRSIVHGNDPSLQFRFMINPLEYEHRQNLVAHLYSAHLMHRENKKFPTAQWTQWPLRPDYEEDMDHDSDEQTAALDGEGRLSWGKRVEYETLKSSVSDSRSMLDGNSQFGNKRESDRRLPTFDSNSAAPADQPTPNITMMPLHLHYGTKVMPNIQNHGGSTRYTSVKNPSELPYEDLARGMPPFDYEHYRVGKSDSNPIASDMRNKVAFEHARKLLLVELSAAFEREVHNRIYEQNLKDKVAPPRVQIPLPETRRYIREHQGAKIRRSYKVINEGKPWRNEVPIIDPPIRMPPQALNNLMQTLDRVLTDFGRKGSKSTSRGPDANESMDWISMIHEDAHVGRTLERCKALFLDKIEDPRLDDLGNSSSSDSDGDGGSESEIASSSIHSSVKEKPITYLHQPKTTKMLGRLNMVSTHTPLPYIRPAVRVHEPHLHAAAHRPRYMTSYGTEHAIYDIPTPRHFVASAGPGSKVLPQCDASASVFSGNLAAYGVTGSGDWMLDTYGLDPQMFHPQDMHARIQGYRTLRAREIMARAQRVRRAHSRVPALKSVSRRLYKMWKRKAALRKRVRAARFDALDRELKLLEAAGDWTQHRDKRRELCNFRDGFEVGSVGSVSGDSSAEDEAAEEEEGNLNSGEEYSDQASFDGDQTFPYEPEIEAWNDKVATAMSKSGEPNHLLWLDPEYYEKKLRWILLTKARERMERLARETGLDRDTSGN